jgi:hypothetical protein
LDWLEGALDAPGMKGSPTFRARGKPFSIGPVADVVSFHNYEGLDSAFSREPRTVAQVFEDVRNVFEKWEQRAPGFTYAPKQDFWHTEGNFDFLGALSKERRAAWRWQFFTRAFAAGIRKVAVMDPSGPEQTAIRAYTAALPDPFPMLPVTNDVAIMGGQVIAFRHPDAPEPNAGQVWVIWALAGTGAAQVELPVRYPRSELLSVDGQLLTLTPKAQRVRVDLKGDGKMPPPVMLLDRPNKKAAE